MIEIEVPPLRQRRRTSFRWRGTSWRKRPPDLRIARLRLDATTLDYLTAYAWPGNVRELENAIERAAVFCKDGVIRPRTCLRGSLVRPAHRRLELRGSGQSLQEVERRHIQAVLESVGGNRRKAAQVLGISTATLWRRLKVEEVRSVFSQFSVGGR